MIHSTFEHRVVVPDDVLFRDLAGESVLLNLDTEYYFGLDEVGTRMWQVLTAAPSIQDAYETLLGEYEVEPDVLKRDLTKLISELLEHGLADLRDG